MRNEIQKLQDEVKKLKNALIKVSAITTLLVDPHHQFCVICGGANGYHSKSCIHKSLDK